MAQQFPPSFPKKGILVIMASILVSSAVAAVVSVLVVSLTLQKDITQVRTPAQNESPQEGSQNDSVALPDISGLYVADAMGRPSNQHTLLRFSRRDGQKETVGTIENNYFSPFRMVGTSLQYVNPEGELAVYDFVSKEKGVIKIPGIEPATQENYDESKWRMRLHDFWPQNGTVYYLKGDCTEGTYCALGKYEKTTGSNEIIVDNLHAKLSTVYLNNISFDSFDEQGEVLWIKNIGGDAAYGWGDMYAFDVAAKTLEKSGSATYVDCAIAGDVCSDQEQRENDLFGKMFASEAVYCGSVEAGYETSGALNVMAGDTITRFVEAVAIGCIE